MHAQSGEGNSRHNILTHRLNLACTFPRICKSAFADVIFLAAEAARLLLGLSQRSDLLSVRAVLSECTDEVAVCLFLLDRVIALLLPKLKIIFAEAHGGMPLSVNCALLQLPWTARMMWCTFFWMRLHH